MGKLILDDELRTKLSALQGRVELCDPDGRTIGYFMDARAYQGWLYEVAKDWFTDEEIAEGRNEEGGMTTQELLAHLRQIKESREGR